MEKCVIDLFCAVSQIDRRYYNDIGTRIDGTQYPQIVEASFSAELFHRFKSLIELPVNLPYYQNLILNYDITKQVINGRPDIVLHEAQRNRNNQKLFIEVKTDPNVNLQEDFTKIIYATDPDLHFDNAVLVIANRTFQRSKQLVIDNFQFLEIERKKKLFLINAEIQQNRIDYNLFQFTSI